MEPHVTLHLVDLVKQVLSLIGSCHVFADAPWTVQPTLVPDLTMLHIPVLCLWHLV